MHRLTDYDYELPGELIAQVPSERRDHSRLLVLDRQSGTLRDELFYHIAGLLGSGDLLVFNDTKVVPARLLGRRATGGAVEILLLEPVSGGEKKPAYKALIKPLGRLKEGEKILLKKGFVCRLLDAKNRIVDFDGVPAPTVMKKAGCLPLPPYVRRSPGRQDSARYQTVYARHPGAVAAPTAGLHFTRPLLSALKAKGVRAAFLTLHVGYGTFSPVRCGDIRQHRMHEEYFRIPEETVRAFRETKKSSGRVIAVGTTAAKALEDAFCELQKGPVAEISRSSRLFIHPPFRFRAVDAMITNFHLPRTSLLMLVGAFAGNDLIRRAYEHAAARKYRFYSYGDAMLIV
ncbi:MAG: tRNA preQ1(34) S-adenosylmethionine ribosyltransferase-isomerase QueA [Candidatus Omnitrophota bacterium]